MVLINTKRFLHGSKLCEETRTSQVILVSKKKSGGIATTHFLEKIKLQNGKERQTLLCILKLFTNIVH